MENEQTPKVAITLPVVTQITSDSITVTWDYQIEGVPEDSVRFEIFLKGEKADGSPFDRIAAQEKNSCTVTGLKGETTYSLFVVAVHEGEDIAQSPDNDEGVVVTTPKSVHKTNWKKIALIAGCALAAIALVVLLVFLIRDTKAPVIDNPEVSSFIKDNEVTLAWHKATDNKTLPQNIRYHVSRTDESGEWLKPQVILGDTSYTFAGLKPWTYYKFIVEALDENGNSRPYTDISLRTTDSDAPEIMVKSLRSHIEEDQITISWNPAMDMVTDQTSISYLVSRTDESEEWGDPIEVKADTSYTFTGLKPGTDYKFHVEAQDENGNCSPYMDLSLKTADTHAPEIAVNSINTQIHEDAVILSWNPAKDNATEQKSIRYHVSRTDESGEWMKPTEIKADTSFAFSGLKPGTEYKFRVEAIDKRGNKAPYSEITVKTIERVVRISRLAVSVRQGASVLYGTNTICLDLQYTAVQYDENGKVTARKPGNWKYKWSNKNTANTVIQLPAGWYFENNRVYIYIDSRKAASAGLNKWKKCSDGYLDISTGSLILELSGSYYSHNVRFKRLN